MLGRNEGWGFRFRNAKSQVAFQENPHPFVKAERVDYKIPELRTWVWARCHAGGFGAAPRCEQPEARQLFVKFADSEQLADNHQK